MGKLIKTVLLKWLMGERGVSVKQMAESLGVSQSAIYAYLKAERTPTLEHLVKIAGLLNVEVGALLKKSE